MKHVEVTLEAYNYFSKRLLSNDGGLVEDWRNYCNGTINKFDRKHWEELYEKVGFNCDYRSAGMVMKLISQDITFEPERPKKFVFYKGKIDDTKRYYGEFIETTFPAGASKYEVGDAKDEEHMKALELLGWIKEEYKD